MNKIPKQYTPVAQNVPCPMPGREDYMILTTHDGQPAIWQDGTLYTKPAPTQITTEWVQNLDRIQNKDQ